MHSLSTTYNLYSPSPLPLVSPLASPKPPKKQIQIVFHHPNLLYLQKRCPKGKEQIAQEVEQNIMREIQSKKTRRQLCKNKCGELRPKTCDPWAGDDQRLKKIQEELRCKTTQGKKRNRNLKDKQLLQVFGKSSKVLSPCFDLTPSEPSQHQFTNSKSTSTRIKKPTLLNLLSTASSSSKVPLWKSYFTTPTNKQQIKVSMSLQIQKKFMKYNKSDINKVGFSRRHRMVR